MFAKILTEGEIKKMYGEGMCSPMNDEKFGWRQISWESILKWERNEKVREIEIPECKEDPKPDPKPEPSNKWDILRKEDYFHRELTMDLYKKLIGRTCPYNMLGDFIGVKISDNFIKHLESCDEE